MGASRVVVCMCGLPASGKSTFSSLLVENLRSNGFEARVIRFDDALEELMQESDGFSVEVWRGARNESFAQLEAALRGFCGCGSRGKHDCGRPNVVVVDDNMHLPSMRREVYVLAREAEAALVFVYMQASAEAAHRRNNERSVGQVGDEVIDNMAAAFTPPGSRPFEKHCCTIANECVWVDAAAENMWEQELEIVIQQIMTIEPLESVEAKLLQEMQNKHANAHDSIRHTIDLTLRKWISQVMAQISNDSNIHGFQRQIAAALSQAKKLTVVTLREDMTADLQSTTETTHERFVHHVTEILGNSSNSEIASTVEMMLRQALEP